MTTFLSLHHAIFKNFADPLSFLFSCFSHRLRGCCPLFHVHVHLSFKPCCSCAPEVRVTLMKSDKEKKKSDEDEQGSKLLSLYTSLLKLTANAPYYVAIVSACSSGWYSSSSSGSAKSSCGKEMSIFLREKNQNCGIRTGS